MQTVGNRPHPFHPWGTTCKPFSVFHLYYPVRQTFSVALQSNTLTFLQTEINNMCLSHLKHAKLLTDAEIMLCAYSVKHVKRSASKESQVRRSQK